MLDVSGMGFGTQEENLKATTELSQQLAAESNDLVLPCFRSLLHTRVFVGPCQSESLQLADPTENLVCDGPDPRSCGEMAESCRCRGSGCPLLSSLWRAAVLHAAVPVCVWAAPKFREFLYFWKRSCSVL